MSQFSHLSARCHPSALQGPTSLWHPPAPVPSSALLCTQTGAPLERRPGGPGSPGLGPWALPLSQSMPLLGPNQPFLHVALSPHLLPSSGPGPSAAGRPQQQLPSLLPLGPQASRLPSTQAELSTFPQTAPPGGPLFTRTPEGTQGPYPSLHPRHLPPCQHTPAPAPCSLCSRPPTPAPCPLHSGPPTHILVALLLARLHRQGLHFALKLVHLHVQGVDGVLHTEGRQQSAESSPRRPGAPARSAPLCPDAP